MILGCLSAWRHVLICACQQRVRQRKADQLPRNYGGSVDFDILGSKWSQQARSSTL